MGKRRRRRRRNTKWKRRDMSCFRLFLLSLSLPGCWTPPPSKHILHASLFPRRRRTRINACVRIDKEGRREGEGPSWMHGNTLCVVCMCTEKETLPTYKTERWPSISAAARVYAHRACEKNLGLFFSGREDTTEARSPFAGFWLWAPATESTTAHAHSDGDGIHIARLNTVLGTELRRKLQVPCPI